MKLLIMAQNPKKKINVLNPMKGTRSWTLLEQWLTEAGIPLSDVKIQNTFQAVGSRKLSTKGKLKQGGWIKELIGAPVIVCLGALARSALVETRTMYYPQIATWDHFFIPHPSGLNRVLNNPEEHLKAVETLRKAHGRLKQLRSYERV